MENKTCPYEACNEPVNSPHDESLCVFHTPKEKKGINVEEFNELIWRRINGRCYNFRGFIFPGDISFRGECRKQGGPIAFAKDVNFSNAQFLAGASFEECQFSGKAIFSGAQFSGACYFSNAKFSGGAFFFQGQFSGDASFPYAQFSGKASFDSAQFSGEAYFYGAQFEGDADFSRAQFSGATFFLEAKFPGEASFHSVKFSGDAYFNGAQFSGDAYYNGAQFSGDADFSRAQFSGDASFLGITIESILEFSTIKFEERAIFNLEFPSFKGTEEEKSAKNIAVIFDRVRFNPFAAWFEKIYADNSPNHSNNPVLIFRYCQLKDVFFNKSDMSLFSFYKSSFDEARFISSRWSDTKDKILGLIPYRRKNVIAEENMQSEIDEESNEEVKTNLRAEYMIEDLAGPDDIASLYRRMKTALDRSKDYEQSGWFYFNEFEMKRRALKEEVKNGNIFKTIFSRLPLYNIYKTFAGYGEKPLWSFWWFLIFSAIFAVLHMLNGLDRVGVYHYFDYSLDNIVISLPSLQFWKDFFGAWSFSLSRLIPANYLSAEVSNYHPVGGYGSLISFLNFVVLFVMATFIFIGLKRHFRRF